MFCHITTVKFKTSKNDNNKKYKVSFNLTVFWCEGPCLLRVGEYFERRVDPNTCRKHRSNYNRESKS